MVDPPTILFFLDEQLPVWQATMLLAPRGHQVVPVHVGFKDPAIIVTANEKHAVILTADHWFLKELYRHPPGHKRYLGNAGVIQVPGEWDRASQRLSEYLPVIEPLYAVRQTQRDRRLGVDLSQGQIRIHSVQE